MPRDGANAAKGLVFGSGQIAATIAFVLAAASLLGVLGFHFPAYLTTPDLRAQYSAELIRTLIFWALLIAGGLSLGNIILNKARGFGIVSFALVLLAVAMGGSRVPVAAYSTPAVYLGLDWFTLDLLGSALVFIAIEKLLPLYREQPVFRFGWQTDLTHFFVNHLLVGVVLLLVNYLIHHLFSWAIYAPLQQAIASLPFVAELMLILLVADLVQYWTHRAYHEIPFLWRFHAVHHSAKVMDWLAGSRQHALELVATRVSILGTLYVLGFSKEVLDAYIIIVGFQAVFNHANVSIPWGPLKYVFVTPDFHHWHHSSDREALDRNYAAHFAFLDYLFGTAVKSDRRFPEKYGVLGDYMPESFVRQQAFPFVGKMD
ncbi:MAG: hypothetical protein RIR70_389 [Pseudomonadota bacterium]